MLETLELYFGNLALNAIVGGVIALILVSVLLSAVNKALDKSTKINKTVVSFIKPVVKFVAYFFVFMLVANKLGMDTSSIVALASVCSAAIALAAQNILSNLFGGVTLLINRPFEVGDYINAAGSEGIVQSISIFYTILNTLDNKVVTIPNGSISSATIVNFSKAEKRRVDLVVSACYSSKVEDVKKSIANAIAATENVDANDQFVRLSNYGSSAIDYTIRVWTDSANYWQVYFDLLENVKVAFDKDGITMTYDHIIVHTSKD